MCITGGKLNAPETAGLQLLEQLLPALSRFTKGNLEPKDLPISVFADTDYDQGLRRSDCSLTPNVYPHCIGQEERILLFKRALGPGFDLLAQPLGQVAYHLPTELPSAELGRDLLDPACRHPLDYHLHQRQNQRLL